MSEGTGSRGSDIGATRGEVATTVRRPPRLLGGDTLVSSGTPSADRALLRRVRRRLVVWSGGVTLVILIALGSAIYLGVASSLRASGQAQLQQRAELLAQLIARAPTSPDGDRPGRFGLGFAIGGPASGTIALLVTPQDQLVGAPEGIVESPDLAGARTARATGATVFTETTFAGVPVQVISVPTVHAGIPYVVQVIADRTAEARTLAQLALVLLIGGLAALALAVIGGWIYASRALQPIRESLRRQREFAADASHELRTPLAVARAGIDHLARHPERQVAEMGDTVRDVQAGLQHMTALVDTLLLLARADSGSLDIARSEVDLADIAATALAGLEPLARERGVALRLDAEPAETLGDPLRLRQLVGILVDNAIRHGRGAGGSVWVAVRSADGGSGPQVEEATPSGPPGGAPTAAPVEGRPASGVSLIVDDDGPGIPPENRARVFERFWRGEGAPPGGAGLGLPIAAWIAERHGGSVSIEDRPGGGTRVRIRLD